MERYYNELMNGSAYHLILCSFIIACGAISLLSVIGRVVKNLRMINTIHDRLIKNHLIERLPNNKYLIDVKPDEYLYDKLTHLTVDSVPILLTTLGIFGTFCGVWDGMPRNATNVVDDNIRKLITSLGTAFSASIAAVAFAAFYSLLGVIVRFIQSFFISSKIESLKEYFIFETPTYYLRKESKRNDEFAEKLRIASVGLVEASKTMSESIDIFKHSVDPEKTATLLGDAVNQVIIKELKPTFVELEKRFKALDGLKEAALGIEDTNAKLSKYIMNDLEGVFNAVQQSLQEAKVAIETTNVGLVNTNAGIEGQLQNLKQLDSTLSNFSQEMKVTLSEANDLFKNQIRELSTQAKDELEAMTKAINEANAGFTVNMNRVPEVISENLTKFSLQYEAALKQYLDLQAISLDEQLGRHAKQLQVVMDSFGDTMKKRHEQDQVILNHQNTIVTRATNLIGSMELHKGYIEDKIIDLSEKTAACHKVIEGNSHRVLENFQSHQIKLEELSSFIEKELGGFKETQVNCIKKYQNEVDENIARILGSILQTSNNLYQLANQTISEDKEL